MVDMRKLQPVHGLAPLVTLEYTTGQ